MSTFSIIALLGRLSGARLSCRPPPSMPPLVSGYMGRVSALFGPTDLGAIAVILTSVAAVWVTADTAESVWAQAVSDHGQSARRMLADS
eukprot:5086183-Amphidinium_carterae.1